MYNIQEAFRDGVKGYTPSTMWFTSGNINKNEMTYQIEGFKREGIEDYFIHPSNGTQGDYLGEYFFCMIKHAAAEAKRLGINFWIYDEYNWPSGVAGGQVLLDEPWTHSSCLCKITVIAAAGETIEMMLPEKKRFNTTPLLFIVDGAEAVVVLDGDVVTWTNDSAEEKSLEVYFSKWTLGKIAALRDSGVVAPVEGYLDTLDPEAVSVFINKTHEEYKKHIGEGFGEYVKGIFTDEVVTSYLARQKGEEEMIMLPWTRLFLDKFIERNSYDIRPRLSELFSNTSPKLNVDYWETVSDLFMDAFMSMTYDWCTENKLIYTGHINGEESIQYNVFISGDPYEYYKRFTWPGIDTICTYYRMNDYSYNITAKLASSAAHFLGKERVLSETFTISGWDIRLRDMKRVFNRLALLGITFIQYMGSRYDFSPAKDNSSMTNNWQNPLFKHYRELSRYISGIQWLIANTTYHAKVLLFYPVTTVRAELSQFPKNPYGGEINMTLDGLVNSLLNLNVPFEIGYEQVIDNAELNNGKLRIAGTDYDTVILPCIKYIKERTFNVLQTFAQGGGCIVVVNGNLEKVIGDDLYDAPALHNAVVYECRDYELIDDGSKFTFETIQKAPMGTFTSKLGEALEDRCGLIVQVEPCDGIMSAVRKSDDTYYVMIVNDNDGISYARGKVLIDMPFRAIATETGETKPIKVDGKNFEIKMCAYECVVLELSYGLDISLFEDASIHKETKTEIQLEKITFNPDGLNIGLPKMLQVRGEAAEKIIQARRAYNSKRVCDIAESLADLDLILCRRPKDRYIPVKGSRDWFGWYPIDDSQPAPGETVVCVYDFTLDSVPETLELVGEPQIDTVWFLNDEQLYQTSSERIWHYANTVFDISGIVSLGDNRLVSICTLPDYESKFSLPVAVLRGDFRMFNDLILTERPGGNALDYWNDQGYMCYTGDGTYSMEFTAVKDMRVILELDTTDVAEVLVNRNNAGKRIWDPYVFDLSSYLIDGVNKLDIRITSTLSNLLYGRNLSGLKDARLYML